MCSLEETSDVELNLPFGYHILVKTTMMELLQGTKGEELGDKCASIVT